MPAWSVKKQGLLASSALAGRQNSTDFQHGKITYFSGLSQGLTMGTATFCPALEQYFKSLIHQLVFLAFFLALLHELI